jgi:hypothetical protein
MLRTCLAFLTICSGLRCGAADWPQYRGPAGSGVADGDAPVEFGPGPGSATKKNLLWSADGGSGHSSPIVWGDSLFLTSKGLRTDHWASVRLRKVNRACARSVIAPCSPGNWPLLPAAVSK